MKTDADLKREIEAELAWDPAVKSTAIGVAVRNGVVTLSGHLENYAEKWAVEDALRRVAGVKAIALELDVRLSPDHQRNDTEIARAAEAALNWHSRVPTDDIRLTVDKGWITLQGEVEWDYQRKSAEKTLQNLQGVTGVINHLTLKHKPVPIDLQDRIRAALTRQAEREAKHIDIAVQDGTVTLQGTVHSWKELEAAQGAAWSAPGVKSVISQLKVE